MHRISSLPSIPPFESHVLGFAEVLKGYMLKKYPTIASSSGVRMGISGYRPEKKLMTNFRELGSQIANGEIKIENLYDQIDLIIRGRVEELTKSCISK